MSEGTASTQDVSARSDSECPAAGGMPFDASFVEQLRALMIWRRDVRQFQTRPLAAGTLERLIEAANTAPSVGYSQPWRFVSVETTAARASIRANFAKANAAALASYAGEKAELYASLKLAGLEQAPDQLAVFCDMATPTGSGLGRQTMPEMLRYSVVAAVQHLSLAARAEAIGVGWVSILDPDAVAQTTGVPGTWQLIAYLCVGYPVTTSDTPELSRRGWEQSDQEALTLRRV